MSFIATALFIFDVIAPQRIERASQDLQDELDPSRGRQSRGSLEEFLRNYNQIESRLSEAGRPYRPLEIVSAEARQPRRFSNVRLAEILFRDERISHSLYQRLRELITLRNAIIHGAEPIVSQEIVEVSGSVLRELREVLTQE